MELPRIDGGRGRIVAVASHISSRLGWPPMRARGNKWKSGAIEALFFWGFMEKKRVTE